ncbi:MAG: hypothetical protein DME22_10095, partial [Verrucomicrobia bacterium]
FLQRLFHGFKSRRLDDCFNLLHSFPLSVENFLILSGAHAPGNRQDMVGIMHSHECRTNHKI